MIKTFCAFAIILTHHSYLFSVSANLEATARYALSRLIFSAGKIFAHGFRQPARRSRSPATIAVHAASARNLSARSSRRSFIDNYGLSLLLDARYLAAS